MRRFSAPSASARPGAVLGSEKSWYQDPGALSGRGFIWAIFWKGPLEHIGPVDTQTSTHAELYQITNCGLYVFHGGVLLTAMKQTAPLVRTDTPRNFADALFASQFDWRCLRTYFQSYQPIEGLDDKAEALRHTLPQYWTMYYQSVTAFFPRVPPIEPTTFLIKLTSHLLAKKDRAGFKEWVDKVLERLQVVAHSPNPTYPERIDFASQADYEAAVLPNHGTPLPAEVLNPSIALEGLDLLALAEERLRSIDANASPFLHAPAEIEKRSPDETFYEGWRY